ncbi:MAG: matrixin family metalloprotease [Planctomycetota bacterium]
MRRLHLFALSLLPVCFGVGCPTGTLPGGTPTIGSTISTATPLTLDSNEKAVLSSTIEGSKVDVYDLGAVSPGDRIIVSVRPSMGSSLDPTTAIFDESSVLFAINDDADTAAGRVDSAIDDYIAIGGDHIYLAISKYFFANVGGAYEGDVEIRRGQTAPTAPQQVLLLNFASGSVTIPDEGTFTYGVFDAADIDATYAGQTAAIKAKIIEVVKQNYQQFGINIISSDDPPVDNTNCVVSTIHFGAFSQTKFGIAQSVDDANRKRCDDGIVFTDDFDKPFTPKPSVDGIAIAIANVAAHEAGHLLGLNHTTDITDLMDTTGSASTLLADQEFKTAALAPSIFPFGKQDGVAMLNRVIPK